MPESPASSGARACVSCGTQLSSVALVCPVCSTFVHAEELKLLSARAKDEEARGDLDAAYATLTRMGQLLPRGTRQGDAVVAELSRMAALRGSAEVKQPLPGWAKSLGPIGVALAFILGKGKLLLLGLTKLSTLATMLVTFGLYMQLYGAWFAAGFILSIYVHEMGHVAALRAAGIPASAPMFIPGFGAFVRLHARPPDAITDARIGLAGPVWGLGAAIACIGAGLLWPEHPVLLAIGTVGARINLFNLIPIWQLDGGRGMNALDRRQRIGLAVLCGLLFWARAEPMLILVGLGILFRVFEREQPQEGHWPTLWAFAGLLVTLGLLATFHVPTGS